MFIYSKRNVIIPAPDNSRNLFIKSGFAGDVPDWAGATPYFQALVKDGKITVPASHRDRDTQKADEAPVKVRRGKKTAEE